ncbi:cation:proton antiporter [Vibrio parahaemolyticus]|nr:cation:proton antiporter [Vibrio parahaemolyticus]
MQTTIAITAGSMVLSLLILIAGQNNWFHLTEIATETVTRINFEDFLLKGILGFLLFAGGLGIKLPNLKDQKWEITVLALGATLFSTFFIGFVLYGLCMLIGIQFDLVYCLLFGALISPTDPIAVLAIVKKLDAPKRISTQIEGSHYSMMASAWLFSSRFSPLHLAQKHQQSVASLYSSSKKRLAGSSMAFYWA